MTREHEAGIDPDEHWSGEMIEEALEHPTEWALRSDRIPHIWCSGCGVGITMGCFTQALKEAEVDLNRLATVSGIGCSGRISGYMNCDTFHTTHGRAIPFALGLHVGNPSLEVVVLSGDGDLLAIGGNHLIHAARRNADLTVVCVNNFNYGMTGGQAGPSSHTGARTTTTPYGNAEASFNVPYLVAAAGATYVARWTVLDLGRIRRSMVEALKHKGFAFIEIISPCPIYYGRFNKRGDAVSEMRYYRDNAEVINFAPLESCDLRLGGRIVVGKFVEKSQPTFLDVVRGEIDPRAQGKAARAK
ncbi:MAG: thiamine pyrophosphate-dependent enzyme [Acidobacteriota bacterium]